MICYKWVIKEKNYYKPIINNGAFKPANNIKLRNYKKGQTINGLVDVQKILRQRPSRVPFHRSGFHFWKDPTKDEMDRYNRCMKRAKNLNINCTLKCYIRQKRYNF